MGVASGCQLVAEPLRLMGKLREVAADIVGPSVPPLMFMPAWSMPGICSIGFLGRAVSVGAVIFMPGMVAC